MTSVSRARLAGPEPERDWGAEGRSAAPGQAAGGAVPSVPGPGCAVGLGSTAARLSAGGAVSLLALNGLFILIHKHNL